MLSLSLGDPAQPLNVLCLGAHSDDIEIGAGATILQWLADGRKLNVRWCVASAIGERQEEARASALEFLEGAQDVAFEFGDFRDGYFPSEASRLKDWVESLKSGPKPDIILTHRRDDAHQDHRTICELTWNAFRDHVILEYEIPKWDGDVGRPNIYVQVSDEALTRKIALLDKHFGTQRSKAWFDDETFRGLARLRGVECRTRYAEAYVARKMLLG